MIEAKLKEPVIGNSDRANNECLKALVSNMTFEEKKAVVSALPADLMFAELVRRYSNLEIRENAIKDIVTGAL